MKHILTPIVIDNKLVNKAVIASLAESCRERGVDMQAPIVPTGQIPENTSEATRELLESPLGLFLTSGMTCAGQVMQFKSHQNITTKEILAGNLTTALGRVINDAKRANMKAILAELYRASKHVVGELDAMPAESKSGLILPGARA